MLTRATSMITGRRVIAVLVGAVVVLWAFPRAIEDWQFQLAGMADPFLGRPAPGVTVVLGVVASVVVLGVVVALGRSGRPAINRTWLILPLIAGWVAYGSGAALTLAGGGQESRPGTLQYELGAPVTHAATVPAVCRTPVGKPTALAEVRPTMGSATPAVAGLPMLQLRDRATGAVGRSGPSVVPVASGVGDGNVIAPFEVPGLPDRPRPYLEAREGHGAIRSEPPIGFLAAYDYAVTSLEDHGLSGVASIVATRWEDPYDGGGLRWVNLRIPDDPWPDTFELTIDWSC